jgi:type II secretory pathway pseudopilin PulG
MPSSSADQPKPVSPSPEAAYTVLELLVSLALLVLFLGAGLTGLSVALRADRQATFLTQATLLGQTKLAAAGVDFPLRPGTTARNLENGLAWWAEVRLQRTARLTDGGVVRSYKVRITVADPSAPNGRAVSFTTVALRTEEGRS